MTGRPLILVTNDDGIASPGLAAAVAAVYDLADLLVIAPKHQQTGASRNFLRHPGTRHDETLAIDGQEAPAIAVEASPAQVTRTGIMLFAPRKPELVIAGINYGENLGIGVTISGTVGASIEAASLGVPALAVSLETDIGHHLSHDDAVDFTTAAVVTRRLVQRILVRPLPAGIDILNVNVPQDATPDTPWRVTRVSRQSYFHSRVNHDPAKDQPEFVGYERRVNLETLEPDSDIHALFDGVVSVCPLSIDLTAHRQRPELATWLEASNQSSVNSEQ
ncbi:MAG: 5'/3'-nucleotidase SurE [Anaerolineae bacterium]